MKKSKLTSRERMELALRRQEPDRVPRYESFWADTLKRWRGEGAPFKIPEDLWVLFDFDMIPKAGARKVEAFLDVAEVLEQTAEWRTVKNGDGAILRQWKDRSGTPEHVGFTVKDPDSWKPYRAALVETPIEARIDFDLNRQYFRMAQEQKRWHAYSCLEAFELAKNVIGHETLCVGIIEEPEWIRDVFEVETDLNLRVLDNLYQRGIRWDGLWVYGDVAFNTGPFLSPAQYRELLKPSHTRLFKWFKDRNLPVIYHTDGRFTPLIDDLLETGVDCFQPLEAKAGMDVRQLKRTHGHRVAFMGNIDVMTLITNDRTKIEAEITSKFAAAMPGGGYIYHSDHSVPPGVSWETYRFVMELVDRLGWYS